MAATALLHHMFAAAALDVLEEGGERQVTLLALLPWVKRRQYWFSC
jgi:hypothetical protein